MGLRYIVVMLLVALVVFPGAALAQDTTPTPSPADGAAVDGREPTEYLAYFAVAMFVVLVMFIGVAYIRAAMRRVET